MVYDTFPTDITNKTIMICCWSDDEVELVFTDHTRCKWLIEHGCPEYGCSRIIFSDAEGKRPASTIKGACNS